MDDEEQSNGLDVIDERASACAQYVLRALGIALDYSRDTLPLVDHYLGTVGEESRARPQLVPLIAQAAGAYFGKVLCGRFDAFWRLPSPNFHDWQVCLRQAFLWINPIGVGYEALMRGADHDGPRAVLRVAPEYQAFVQARLESLPPVGDDEFFLLSTRLEVIETAVLELRARMEQEGYGDTTFELEDYNAELRPLRLS